MHFTSLFATFMVFILSINLKLIKTRSWSSVNAAKRPGNARRQQLQEPIWTKREQLEERNSGINTFIIKYLK